MPAHRILGVDVKTLLFTGNEEEDEAALQAFAAKYEHDEPLGRYERWQSRALHRRGQLRFPSSPRAGLLGTVVLRRYRRRRGIRARNIGRNELLAIDACDALSHAQQMYFAVPRPLDGSTPSASSARKGKQDGLYWPVYAKQAPSPLASIEQFPKSSVGSLSPE